MLRSLSKKILRRSYFNRQGCSSILTNPQRVQNRMKVDADSSKLFTAEELANPLETVYKRMANAPPESPAAIVFETLLRAGKIELKPKEDTIAKEKEIKVKHQKITGQDLTKVSMTFESMPFSDMPLQASDWPSSLAVQLVGVNGVSYRKIKCPIIPEEDLRWVHTTRKLISDPLLNDLKGSAWFLISWRNQYAKVRLHYFNSNDINDHMLHAFFNAIETMLVEPREKMYRKTFADKLLRVTNLESVPLQARPEHQCSVETANGSIITSKYDYAITLSETAMEFIGKEDLYSQNLADHIAAFVQLRPNTSLEGPLVADMIIQAAKNFTIFKTEETNKISSSEDEPKLPLLSMPSTIQNGSTFFSYAIVISSKKVRVWKAEFSTKFLEQFTTKGTTDGPIPKGIIREYDSPSGNGFNVMNIDDLRVLFKILSSLYLSYKKPFLDKSRSDEQAQIQHPK